MGVINSVGELFFLRLFMGICTGFFSLSQAYISTQTPKEIEGRVMGTLQTGRHIGKHVKQGDLFSCFFAVQMFYEPFYLGLN
jgi:MFS family permease